MDETLITTSALAGLIAAAIQWLAIHIGWVRTNKRITALVLSCAAGLLVAVANGQFGTMDFFSAVAVALAASQTLFGLVLTKVSSQ